MTTWYTEAEAAVYLKVPEAALKLARYRKKVKASKFCGVVQYKEEWLDEFREGKCEEHQSSASERDLPSGISPSRKAGGQRGLARAKAIVLMLNESSHNSSSNGVRRN
jgi:hypothetical protein